MRILLDTHILLWWPNDDRSLSRTGRALIADPDHTIFLSPISTWEIWLKKSFGKLELPDDFESVLARQGFEHLPLATSHTRAIAELPWHHRDPFDRMLVAQAMAANLTLLTADARVAQYGSFVKKV